MDLLQVRLLYDTIWQYEQDQKARAMIAKQVWLADWKYMEQCLQQTLCNIPSRALELKQKRIRQTSRMEYSNSQPQ